MQHFCEIKASQLEPGKEYNFSQPLIISGDIPHNVIIKVTAGLLRIEGSLQDKVSLQCDDITINGDVGPGCYLTGRNIIVSGDVLPGIFTATNTIKFVGKVTYKVQTEDGEGLEMLLMAPNIIVPPLKNDQPPSSTAVNKRAQNFFDFFKSSKRLRITTVDEIAISSAAGELNKLTQPKNIPARFKGLVQGLPYLHKKLFELHQKVNANQPPTFTVYGKKGKQTFTLKEHQLRALTEICNGLMRADMQHTTNLFKAVLELPTGAGKTLIFLLLIALLTEELKRLENPPFHVLVIEPIVDLKNQTEKRAKEFSPNLTIADYKKDRALITVVTTVTYQMLARLAKKLSPDAFENFVSQYQGVIFDEAHNIFAELSQEVLNAVLKSGALTLLVSATPIKNENLSLYKFLKYANPGEESLLGEESNPLSRTDIVDLIKKGNSAPIKAALVDVKLTDQTQFNITQEQAQQLEDSEEDLEFLNDPKNLNMLISILVNKGFLGIGGIIRSRNNKNAKCIVDAIEKFCNENAELIEPMIAPMKARYEANIKKKVEKAFNKATQEGKSFDVNAYRASFSPFKIIAACTSATITNPAERKSFARLLKMGSPLWTVGDKMIGIGKDNPWWKVAIAYSPFLSWIALIQFFGRIFRVWNNQIAYAIGINYKYSNQLFYPSAINGEMQVGDFSGIANLQEYPDIDVGEKTEYSFHWEQGNLQIRLDRRPFQSRNSRSSARRPQRIQEQEERISQELIHLENVFKQFEELLEKELPEIQTKKSSLITYRQRSTAAPVAENQTSAIQPAANREETMEIESQPTTISPALRKRIESLTAMVDGLWEAMQKESDDEDEHNESAETIARPQARNLRRLSPVQVMARKLHGLKQQLAGFLWRQHGATATSEIQDEDSAMEREDVRNETEDILGGMLDTLASIRRQWNEQQLSSLVTRVVTQRNANPDQQSAMEIEPITLDLNSSGINETNNNPQTNESSPPSNDIFYITEDDFKNFAEEVQFSFLLPPTMSVSLDFKEWLNKKYPGKTRYGLEENSHLKNLSFIGLDLSQMILRKVFFDRLTVGGIDILGANFFKVDLEGSTFSETSLPHANFKEANLQSIVASQVNWSSGDFEKTNLSDAIIKNSTLRLAKFEGTRCINTCFFNVNLELIRLVNSDFSGAIFINCQMSFLADPINFNIKDAIFYRSSLINSKTGINILQSIAKQGILIFNSVSEVEEKIKSLLKQTTEISSHKKPLERLFRLVEELLALANASLLVLTAEDKAQLEGLLQQQAMDIETTVAESSENAEQLFKEKFLRLKEQVFGDAVVNSEQMEKIIFKEDDPSKLLPVFDTVIVNQNFQINKIDFSGQVLENLLIHYSVFDDVNFKNATFMNMTIGEGTSFDGADMTFTEFTNVVIGKLVSFEDALLLWAEADGVTLKKIASKGGIMNVSQLIERTQQMFSNPTEEDCCGRRFKFLELLETIAVDFSETLYTCTAEEKQQIENLISHFKSPSKDKEISYNGSIFDIKVECFREYANQYKTLRQTDQWPDFREWLNKQYKVNIKATTRLRVPEHTLIVAEGERLSDLKLYQLNMSDVVLKKVMFSHLKLFKAKFERVEASESKFMDVDLNRSRFNEAILKSAVFERGNFAEAKLTEATLLDATFKYSNLAKVDFTGANCVGMCLFRIDLTQVQAGAYFSGTIFIECQNIKSYLYSKVENAVFYKCSFNTYECSFNASSTMESMVINSIAEISQKISFYVNLIEKLLKESTVENAGIISSYKESLKKIFRLIKKLHVLHKEGALELTAEERTALDRLSQMMQREPQVAQDTADDVFYITEDDFKNYAEAVFASSLHASPHPQTMPVSLDFKEWLNKKYPGKVRYGLKEKSYLKNFGFFRLNLSQMLLRNVFFDGLRVSGANNYAANFFKTDLEGSTLSDVNLSYPNFKEANLQSIVANQLTWFKGDFEKANFSDAAIKNSTFTLSNFAETKCIGTCFFNVDLKNIKLLNSDFSDAIFIDCQMSFLTDPINFNFENAVFFRGLFSNETISVQQSLAKQNFEIFHSVSEVEKRIQSLLIQTTETSSHKKSLERLFNLVKRLLALRAVDVLALTAEEKTKLEELLQRWEPKESSDAMQIATIDLEIPTVDLTVADESTSVADADQQVQFGMILHIGGHVDFSSTMFIDCDITYDAVASLKLLNALFFNCRFSQPIEILKDAGAIIIPSIDNIRSKILFYKGLIGVHNLSRLEKTEKIASCEKAIKMIFSLVEKLLLWSAELKLTFEEKLKLEVLKVVNFSNEPTVVPDKQKTAKLSFDDELKDSSWLQNYKISGRDFTSLIARKMNFKDVFIDNTNFNCADLMYLKLIDVTINGTSLNGANLMFAEFHNLTLGEGVSLKDALILGATSHNTSSGGLVQLANEGAILSISRLIQRTTEMFSNPQIEDSTNRRQIFLTVLQQIVDGEWPTLKCDSEEEQQIDSLLARFHPQPLIKQIGDVKTHNFKRMRFCGINFAEFDFADADLNGAMFFYCNFQGAKNLNLSQRYNTIFFGCNLTPVSDTLGAKSPLFFSTMESLIVTMRGLEKTQPNNFFNKILLKRLRIFSYIYLSYPELCNHNSSKATKLADYLNSTQTNTQPLVAQSQNKNITHVDSAALIAAFKMFKLEKTTIQSGFQEYLRKQLNLEQMTDLCLPPDSQITNEDLSYVDFNHMKVKEVIFSNCNLSGAHFTNVEAQTSSFLDCELDFAFLTHAKFNEVYMQSVNLKDAVVGKANFSGGIFLWVDLSTTKQLGSANFTNTIFFDCKFPLGAKLSEKDILVVNSVDELFKRFSSNHLELSTLQKRQLDVTRNPSFFMYSTDVKTLPEKIKLLDSIEQRLVHLANCLNACMKNTNNRREFSESEKKQIKTILSVTKKSVPKELPSDESSAILRL